MLFYNQMLHSICDEQTNKQIGERNIFRMAKRNNERARRGEREERQKKSQKMQTNVDDDEKQKMNWKKNINNVTLGEQTNEEDTHRICELWTQMNGRARSPTTISSYQCLCCGFTRFSCIKNAFTIDAYFSHSWASVPR